MIDLFSGIGGIRIAFEENGVKCVCSSEIDKYACQTYYDNFKDIPLGDISKIDKTDLPEFDILAGGFPCQPFSLGGLRKGFEDARGTLFFEIARLLDECKPKAFLLENVEGLVSHDKGRTLSTIETILNNLNYNFKWKVMNAKDYGIPQNRSRWYCVGFRNDINVLFEDDVKVDAIQINLPFENSVSFVNPNKINIFQFPHKTKLSFTIADIIEKNVDDCYRISDVAMNNISKYKTSFIESHKSEMPLIAYEVRASRCSFRNDGISPCLTAKMGTGGNNVPIIVSQGRKLTEQECLRLMGFPNWYKIAKNSSHSYKQLGNSVVVPIVSKLAKEIKRVLSQA